MAVTDRSVINVPIGEIECGRAPQILTTLLGSCVGFIVQDLKNQICALAHVVRPNGTGAGMGPGYFADRAAPTARDAAIRIGADPRQLMVRLAGGGAMFDAKLAAGNIGQLNVAALREVTHKLGMVFGGQLVGARDGGCILAVDTVTGRAEVRSLREREFGDRGWRTLVDEMLQHPSRQS
ncbi:MAG: chemotaxis protein CheD [Planctomycetota bacterium]|nr:chemotaxis protein CheD [Planctomycetota bacterium]